MFYHPGRLMTEQALSRLKAIQEYSSLGSGYRLAMRDLEIRGAGNMLGAEQSGHIMEVGFELYCELLEQAVREAKGISEPTSREVQVDLKLKAFIPETYITDERQRMAIYRRMNVISSKEQLDRLEQELGDRFGPIPAGLNALLKILNLKLFAMQSNVLSIKQEADIVSIEWVSGKRKKIKVGGKDLISLVLTNILG
jgi:transcription-repair coupling factor (superfamily II helicase)